MTPKRWLAGCMAAVFLLSLCACGGGGTSSVSSAGTTTTTTGGDVSSPNSTVSGGDLPDYSYTIPELPDYGDIPFSTAAVMPGDPNFEVGKYYDGPSMYTYENVDVGMWVWDHRIIIGQDPVVPGVTCDEMLDLLIQCGTTEIYLTVKQDYYMDMDELMMADGVVPDDQVSEMMLRGFIKKCARFGIKVSLLETITGVTGLARFEPNDEDEEEEYYWTKAQLMWLADFNSRATDDDEKFIGLHIDCEADWNGNGDPVQNVQNFATWLITMNRFAADLDMIIALDLLAGFYCRDTFQVVDETGTTVPLMDVITKQCPTLTLMAYRRSARQQFEAVQTELGFAQKNGCTLIVAAETGEPATTGDNSITYWTLDFPHFKDQQKRLVKSLEDAEIDSYGIAVHCSNSLWQLAIRDKDLPDV